jgi:putative transposase
VFKIWNVYWVVQKIKPIPELVGAFKTTSSKKTHQAGCKEFKWQKSYHDRIIRDNEELLKIKSYIQNNPIRWNNS